MNCPKSRPPVGAKTQTIWMADKVIQTPVGDLKPYKNNNRVHREKNITKLKASVKQFGFVTPILVDGDGVIIAGHGRYQAAKSLGVKSVPTVIATHLTDPEVRALRVADNKLAELSDWNEEALQIEFADLMDMSLEDDLDFGLEITGFEMPVFDCNVDEPAGHFGVIVACL